MKACDVVTGLRAEVEQWRARAIRAETRGTGHDQIECQRAEIGRLRADLARVVAERDEARAIGRGLSDEIRNHREAARMLLVVMYGAERDVCAVGTHIQAAATLIANQRTGMERLQRQRDEARAEAATLLAERDEARAAARLTTVPAGGRVVSADLWERLSALADAVREVPDAD